MSRVRQFFRDLAAPWMPLDEEMIRELLSEKEEASFRRLRRAEMQHSIRVAKDLREELAYREDSLENKSVIRAALLHDLGKIRFPLGPFGKTAMVLFGARLKTSKSPAADVYFNHPRYGMVLLRELDSFAEFPWLYDLIQWHHDEGEFLRRYHGSRAEIFRLFRKADDKN